MVAIAYTDIPAPAARATSTAKKLDRPGRGPAVPASDPVVDMATRLLSGPLNQMYALLWRAGVLTVDN
ncbi:MAG: Rv1535 family protein [Mycobacterium sp.]